MIIDDVSDYLKTNVASQELEEGTNLFKGFLPDEPDNCVAVYDTGGATPDRYIPTALPTFQVFIRWDNYSDGRALLDEIVGLLHQKLNITLKSGGKYFYNIFLQGEGAHIGRDPKERDEFSVNFIAKIRR